MKKLIFICGANGIGKSTVSQAILTRLEKAAYVDSEYCCWIHPFELNPQTAELFRLNIAALIGNSLRSPAIETVIFPYGFHGLRKAIFEGVVEELNRQELAYTLCPVVLECGLEENIRRMRADHRDEARIQRAVANTRHIYDEVPYPRIDVTGMTVMETAEAILRIMAEA